MGKFSKLQVALVAGLVAFSGMTCVQAQDEEERRFENVETERVRPLSQSTARQLEPVRAAVAPEPEEEGGPVPEPNPQLALDEIQDINLDRLPSHERAEIFNLYGYIYYLLDNNQQSKNYYRRVLEEPEANAPLVVRSMKTLATLHMIDEEYQQALDLYLEWMSYQDIVGAPDYAMVGTIYYNLEDFNNALDYTERAINMREENGEIGQENWYSIQRSIYYQRGDYNRVIDILEKLVVYYPAHRYWREMGSMYAELEQEREQFLAYDLAWLQDGLTSGGQVMALASMYIVAGAPYQGAEAIIKGIEDGLVEPTAQNLQYVGDAFYQARSMQEALVWMERAAEEADDGEPYGRLAGIYSSLGRYEDALRSANLALDMGGLGRPDLVQMQAGIALVELYRYDEAIRRFEAMDDERSEDFKADWIRYAQAERNRDQQLRASGIDMDAIRAEI